MNLCFRKMNSRNNFVKSRKKKMNSRVIFGMFYLVVLTLVYKLFL